MKTSSRLDDTLIILVLVALLFLVGCTTEDTRTNKELCQDYTTELTGLQMCMKTPGCRLNDREHHRWKQVGMWSSMYCGRWAVDELDIAEALLDKEVQPKSKKEPDERAG